MKLLTLAFILVSSFASAEVRNRVNTQEYIYDFATSGGASGTSITISNKFGKRALPVGAIIESVHVKPVTAFTSSGTVTATVGNSANVRGYFETVYNPTLVSTSAVSEAHQTTSPFLGTTVQVPYLITSSSNSDVIVTFNFPVTAGKMIVVFKYYFPSL